MTTATLFPVAAREAIELGEGRWLKQLLPFGDIKLPDGSTLRVDHDYVRPVVEAFRQQAFAQVPLQAATDSSQHPDDVDRFRGEVEGLEVRDDGLYGYVRTTDDGTKTVATNPKLGVSVRLLDDYVDSRGRHFKRALHHVAATLSPRVQGMKPWEAISLADPEVEQTYDLTDVPSPVPGTGENTGGGVNMADEQVIDQMVEAAEDDFAQEELARLAAEGGDGSSPAQSTPPPPSPQLSDVRGTSSAAGYLQNATELAETRRQLAEQRAQLEEMRRAYSGERAKREIDQFRLDGVPPSILDLAEPLLAHPNPGVVELADGTSVSPVQVVRAILNECKGFVELGVRHGHSVAQDAAGREDELFEAWAKESNALFKMGGDGR